MLEQTIEQQANLIAALRAVEEANRACWQGNADLIAGALMALSLGPKGIDSALSRLNIAIETAIALSKTNKEIAAGDDPDVLAERERCATICQALMIGDKDADAPLRAAIAGIRDRAEAQ